LRSKCRESGVGKQGRQIKRKRKRWQIYEGGGM
jgi:hypothetical protein